MKLKDTDTLLEFYSVINNWPISLSCHVTKVFPTAVPPKLGGFHLTMSGPQSRMSWKTYDLPVLSMLGHCDKTMYSPTLILSLGTNVVLDFPHCVAHFFVHLSSAAKSLLSLHLSLI